MTEQKQDLHPSAEAFLDALGLSSTYPYYSNTNKHDNGGVSISDTNYEYDAERLNSAFQQLIPSLSFVSDDDSSLSPTTQHTEATESTPPSSIPAKPRLDGSQRYYWNAFLEPQNDTSSSFSCPATLPPPPPVNNSGEQYQQTTKIPPNGVGFLSPFQQVMSIMILAMKQILPGVIAASHLFFRLFLPIILLVAILYLVLLEPLLCHQHYLKTNKQQQQEKHTEESESRNNSIVQKSGSSTSVEDELDKKIPNILSYLSSFRTIILFVGLLCTVVTMTDAMYVFEYGRVPLLLFHFMFCLLVLGSSALASQNHYLYRRQKLDILLLILPMTIIGLIFMITTDLDLPTTIPPGFYYDKSNPTVAKIVKGWPEESRQYTSATPWAVNGDTRTGIPFFLNTIPNQSYVRRWVPSEVPGEEEAIILDIAFPSDGIHRVDKPLYLIVCGLVGGSKEEYVKDLVFRKRQEGSTVAVMITRGLMESHVQGEDLLHFARVSDVDAAAKALRKAVIGTATIPSSPSSIASSSKNEYQETREDHHQVIAGVGYSMGAITLANYVAHSGPNCPLDAAVVFSGALDTRHQLHFHRSRKFWQPLLVKNLRDLVVGKFIKQLQQRLTKQEIQEISIASSVVDFDEKYTVKYHNNFGTIENYYSQMGAMGDFVSFDKNDSGGTDHSSNEEDKQKGVGRIANVSIPLLVVNSLDDPIAYPKCLGDDPRKVSTSGSGFTLLLITEKGGHVGWPVGMNPATTGWIWMSTIASSFVESVQRCMNG